MIRLRGSRSTDICRKRCLKKRCAAGCAMVMTSTQVDEEAQHFYRKLGYRDSGGFIVDIPGCEQPMEMIMIKAL